VKGVQTFRPGPTGGTCKRVEADRKEKANYEAETDLADLHVFNLSAASGETSQR